MDLRESWAFKLWAYADKVEAPRGQRLYRWLMSTGVLGLALVLLFYQLGDGSLHDWDEAIYAQVAREMFLSHTWTTLSWNGAPFFHKPSLHFWLTALTYKMLGVNEFAARPSWRPWWATCSTNWAGRAPSGASGPAAAGSSCR